MCRVLFGGLCSGPTLGLAPQTGQQQEFCLTLCDAREPAVLASNEIGLADPTIGHTARGRPDVSATLHQRVAAVFEHVASMVAGIEPRIST